MLKMEHVKKNYGAFQLDCSLEVQSGRVTALIGPNGAGKSTVFKAALGLIRTDGGSCRIFGKDAWNFTNADRQKIGVVMSNSGFSGNLHIRDITAILSGMYRQFDREEFRRRCREFQLPEDKQIREFSTGMTAKLKILVALSHKASLLLLDEPTAGLDVVARRELLDILREFMEEDESRAVLISSHISSDLEGLCDDLYMIYGGQIVLHEETDVLLDDYAVLKLDQDQFGQIDRRYLLRVRKESWGVSCLTNQKAFYMKHYPGLAAEKGSIDELMTMMVKGESL